jgi:hypothetical protein
VLATASPFDEPEGPGVARLGSYIGLPDGSIRVEVKSRFTCCGTAAEYAVVQQRTYQWTGSSFDQVAGPTTFVADPSVADLAVTVPTLAFGAPVDGFRSATLSVTIRNNGPQTAAGLSFFLRYSWGIEEPSGGDWGRCVLRDILAAVCAIGDVAAGETVTLTVPMRRSSSFEAEETPHLSEYTGLVEARVETPGACCAQRYYPSVTYTLTTA